MDTSDLLDRLAHHSNEESKWYQDRSADNPNAALMGLIFLSLKSILHKTAEDLRNAEESRVTEENRRYQDGELPPRSS